MDSSILKAVGFVHLHVHSAYSLREGALTIEALAKLAQADAMPALAITDTNNLFGALEFSENSSAPKRLLVSVIASAGISSALANFASDSMVSAPSRSE